MLDNPPGSFKIILSFTPEQFDALFLRPLPLWQRYPILVLGFALLAWATISLLDAVVKGRVAARYTPSTDVPWGECPDFWKDTGGLLKWRNILLVIASLTCGLATMLFGKRFAFHFASLFPLEFWGYWFWIWALRIKQKQWFGELRMTIWPLSEGNKFYRLPRFGETPADPAWLRVGPVDLRWLHRRWVVAVIVALNLIGGLLCLSGLL